MPFGGGIDSIVTVDDIAGPSGHRALRGPSPHERFAAIEDAAALTGLPVVRVAREIDPRVRRSAELGFLNGHVPMTAIVTAAALVEAVLDRRDAVVLSNEWSASAPTLVTGGRRGQPPVVQGRRVRARFAAMVRVDWAGPRRCSRTCGPGPSCGWPNASPDSRGFHGAFRSCNRAFHQDPARRLDQWCGTCDKCCFIDLVLAPFMAAADSAPSSAAQEPLENEGRGPLRDVPRAGARRPALRVRRDVDECRAAVGWPARVRSPATPAPVSPRAIEAAGRRRRSRR